jgi:hypothetical protein
MSVRVSTSSAVVPACSGLMYSGVPIRIPCCVNSVRSVSFWLVALATPKSITFSCGLPSSEETSTLDGLMSRWMIPFWCACWIAPHTRVNSFKRSGSDRHFRSQYSVIEMPGTYSMTK